MSTRYILMDNGSLRPQSTLTLRNIAADLSKRLQLFVEPVSLLHSSKIDPSKINDRPAETVVQYIKKHCGAGVEHFVIIPLFFGNSNAFVEYLPDRMEWLKEKGFRFTYEVKQEICLLGQNNELLEHILVDYAKKAKREMGEGRTALVIVDHGTPVQIVHQVRAQLTARLQEICRDDFVSVSQAAMESRDGEEYSFNKPLLLDFLREHVASFPDVPVVISMLFLLPGRHAGPNGDVAEIAEEIKQENLNFKYKMTKLVGEHDHLIEILAERFNAPSKQFGQKKSPAV